MVQHRMSLTKLANDIGKIWEDFIHFRRTFEGTVLLLLKTMFLAQQGTFTHPSRRTAKQKIHFSRRLSAETEAPKNFFLNNWRL